MAMNPRLLRPTSGGDSPASIPGLALWLDASASDSLYQNSDGTVPATAPGDPVGYWRDRSGNGRHATQSTAASRPVVGSQNGRRALTFDGSNDNLNNTPTATVGADAVTFIAAVKHNLTSQPTYLSMPGDMSAGSSGRPITRWQQNDSINRMYVGTTLGAVTSSYRSQPERFIHCIDGRKDNGGSGIHTLREFFDGAQVASVDITATWTTTGQKFNIGSRDDNGTQYKGDICELLVYDRALTAAQRRKIEQYLARRWGITLAPQVANAEAQDWVNRVYAAGSTVSQPVANAVSAFVDGCQADGIWDAMKSVVLLAGADTLAGALAPLKGTAPTSYNFASGDYSKTSGLKGNGSSAYLDTNRAGNADPQNDNHMAMWVSDVGTTATQSFVGSVATVETYLFKNSSGGTGYLNNNASTGVTAQYPGNGSLLAMSRSEASQFLVRLNGANVTRVSASTGVNTIDAFVFARNSGGTPLGHADSTLSFYSIGESLDLALLDARVSALMTAIGVS